MSFYIVDFSGFYLFAVVICSYRRFLVVSTLTKYILLVLSIEKLPIS